MFNNPGQKIKSVSIVLFWLLVITCIISAFVFGFEDVYHPYSSIGGGYTRTEFNAGIFFALLIGGPIISYNVTLFLVGFGELVENSNKLDSKKETDYVMKNEAKSEDSSVTNNESKSEAGSVTNNETKNEVESITNNEAKKDVDTILYNES